VGRPRRSGGIHAGSRALLGALVRHAFDEIGLARLVATTEFANEASLAVMRRLGMRIERNPLPEPAWFQAVGVIRNPRFREGSSAT
jgi:RimJ/RimL family protein N-acetyltransferase